MRPIVLALNILTIAVPKERCLSSAVSIFFRTHFASKNLLQSVSLPLSEIENMEKQIDLWDKESISERGSVAQNLKTKLSETKEKLDKLVSIYLDGDIEREIYLQRKDLLLRQKAKFEESFKDFGQQRKNGVEPLRSFVLSLREAVILEKGENYFAWKEFFQKIGSNPTLKDKTLSCNWGSFGNSRLPP